VRRWAERAAAALGSATAAEFCKEVDGKEGQTVRVAQVVPQGKRMKQSGR
jgi:hypothetical protein